MNSISEKITPLQSGFYFPAEWEKHRATWLSYPHDNSYSWPGTLQRVFPFFNRFIRELSKHEDVCINVRDEELRVKVESDLFRSGVEMSSIRILIHPTNDAWCRDHGPAFVVNKHAGVPKAIVKWMFNAWGDKYPHDLDNRIPELIAGCLGLKVFHPGIVMEGGSVDFNGKGSVITTRACLLNPNRNPGLDENQIVFYLCEYYGVEQVLWLNEGIDGDDTNGHIDDIARFFKVDGLISMVEPKRSDPNHAILSANLKQLGSMRLLSGKQPDIAEIPMPEPVIYENQRLPASYANFYIANDVVIVPVFGCRQDQVACDILEECFPDRKIVDIDSREIIWGLGSFHCLSQQEPL
jgi:agmatine deiminase